MHHSLQNYINYTSSVRNVSAIEICSLIIINNNFRFEKEIDVSNFMRFYKNRYSNI